MGTSVIVHVRGIHLVLLVSLMRVLILAVVYLILAGRACVVMPLGALWPISHQRQRKVVVVDVVRILDLRSEMSVEPTQLIDE